MFICIGFYYDFPEWNGIYGEVVINLNSLLKLILIFILRSHSRDYCRR
jgi:hypothetical protein